MKLSKSCLLILITLSSSLFSEALNDYWKGEEYAKNSLSQKESAIDFMQGKNFTGNEVVLDVGCGDGKITAAMAKALPEGKVVGIDISASMIDFAAKGFSDYNNLSFQIQDAASISFNEQFDLITSFTVMQWVLEQSRALKAFEKALKPGGTLWIQMPTGLPVPMQQALEKTISEEKWKGYFTDFSPPWRFYQEKEYRELLIEANLSAVRMDTIKKQEIFASREVFQGFLSQWFPYLRPLPNDLKETFVLELVDNYLKLQPLDDHKRVYFILDRLEVEAKKA